MANLTPALYPSVAALSRRKSRLSLALPGALERSIRRPVRRDQLSSLLRGHLDTTDAIVTHFERQHLGCGCASSGPLNQRGGPRNYERDRSFQTEHLALDLDLDFEARTVRGKAQLDLARVDHDQQTLKLDALDFDIQGVSIISAGQSSAASYRYDGEQISVSVPKRIERFSVLVHYSAQPQRGLYFLAPDAANPGRPTQAWSQCQDEDARYWFPCQDKPHQKMTTEIKVRVPAGMVVLSNGDLVAAHTPPPPKPSKAKVKPARSKRAPPWWYHFKLAVPHPSYLVTLVAGQFEQLSDRVQLSDGRAVELAYYVPPGKAADGQRAFNQTPNMLRLFSEKTGVPYPFNRYSQIVVSDFIFGGMENTTATTLEEETLLDAKAARDGDSNGLVAHELAHQWFGDYVTCRDWSHAWLNEGFAMFFELVEREARLGRDEYDYALSRDLVNYLAEASQYRRPIVCRDYDSPIDLFDRHLYEKGCLVLHLLRRKLGDERFWRGVNQYLTDHAHGIVETNDLMRALEAVSGKSLERFFDSWVYRPGHPNLKIKISYADGMLSVDVKQTQKGHDVAAFELPLCIEVAASPSTGTKRSTQAGRTKRHTRSLTTANESLCVKLSKAPAWVEIDPDYELLGRVEIECPLDMLEQQLAHGTRARSRWVAAQLLGKHGGRRAIQALSARLGNSKEAWMVRAECAAALGRVRDERAMDALLPFASDSSDRVRRAVLRALGNFKHERVRAPLSKHAARDESYLVQSEAAKALGKARQSEARPLLEKLLSEESWADVVRCGALGGLAALADKQSLGSVLKSSAYGLPTRGRRAAILALPEIAQSREVRRELEALLQDKHPHVRGDAVRALVALKDPDVIPALRACLTQERDGRVQRRIRGALTTLGGDGKAAEQRVARELETLREKLEGLEAKLNKLEQKQKGPRK